MRTVFIIDDDLSVCEGLTRHVNWGNMNMRVMGTAQNGEEALLMLEKGQPDIIITDIYMPKMDGLSLIKQVTEKYPEIHIIIHSGYNHFDNARKAIQYGVKHFFLKPSPVSEIEAVIQDVIQKIEAESKQKKLLEKYQEQRPNYLAYRKDAFIRNQLLNQHHSKDAKTECEELLGIDPETPHIVTAIMISRPPYLTKSREFDWQLTKFSVRNILAETISQSGGPEEIDSYLLDYSDSTYVLVTYYSGNSLYLEQLHNQLVNKMLENLLYYLKVSVIMGVSETKSHIRQMADAYQESMQTLEAGEYEEINQIYYFQTIKNHQTNETFIYPVETIKNIYQKIADKDYDGVIASWSHFTKNISKEKGSPFYMIQTISINVLSALLMEDQSVEHVNRQPVEKSSLLLEVYNYQTTIELLNWMTEQLDHWVSQAKQALVSKKTSSLVEKVKDYIENYYDEEITLAEIADHLFVNKNYLSQLFKKVTGDTFVNYLNHYRIAKAKELLKDKKYMVYEVSEMVGYQNSTYFSQVFKAITEVSPSEYV